ncbi:hypothetical protein Chls_072 [Chlamydia suis]|uniref:Uncharacterized protein n=1 Tax=Chlamydia suis TaxID=83559 RepID=A0ABX6IS85_9CHLA|nr:hypothetical protein Chls_072 [Chlamydia suis]
MNPYFLKKSPDQQGFFFGVVLRLLRVKILIIAGSLQKNCNA